MDEYKALKDKIKTLEESLVSVSKEADRLKEKLDEVELAVYNVEETSLIDRIFFWGENIKPLTKYFQPE